MTTENFYERAQRVREEVIKFLEENDMSDARFSRGTGTVRKDGKILGASTLGHFIKGKSVYEVSVTLIEDILKEFREPWARALPSQRKNQRWQAKK